MINCESWQHQARVLPRLHRYSIAVRQPSENAPRFSVKRLKAGEDEGCENSANSVDSARAAAIGPGFVAGSEIDASDVGKRRRVRFNSRCQIASALLCPGR